MQDDFETLKAENIRSLSQRDDLKKLSIEWLSEVSRLRYSYHFEWMGLPIIQFPQDMVAMQEIIWREQPDLIIETGIARGGSLVFYASMLELLGRKEGTVLGIDIDIRDPNRTAIEAHPMSRRIELIQGSSIDAGIAAQAAEYAKTARSVVVVLDSNHTHDHVLEELRLYAPLVSPGNHLVVFDTVIEDMPEDFFPDRPWGRGNNAKTAVAEFIAQSDQFEIDSAIDGKLQITVAPSGYLRRRQV